MAPSNQTAVLRPPKQEGAAISSTPDGTRQNEPPKRILEIAYAFWRSKALLSAVELGRIHNVGGRPSRSCDSHAPDRNSRTRRARLLRRAGRARCAPARRRRAIRKRSEFDLYLDRRKPTYLGGLLEHLNARHYQNWSLLTAALRTGAPPSGGVGTYKALHDDHPMQEIFLNGMTAGSLLAARAIAAKFPWRKFSTLIDIGTAQGGAAVEIARAHPHLTGGGLIYRPSSRSSRAMSRDKACPIGCVSTPATSFPIPCRAPMCS